MKNSIFMRFPEFRWKALTLSYDDSVTADKHLVEILDKYGLKCTFNLNSGLFAKESSRNMTEQDAVDCFKNSPHEVAVHGVKHYSLSLVDGAAAMDDVLSDRKNLERIFGKIVKGMAYANGSYSDEVVEMLKKCGINYARTVISTEHFEMPTDWLRLPTTCHHANPRLMELAKQFVEAEESWYVWGKTCKMFYLWGHAYEFDDADNWNVIEEFASYMGGRKEIWYATNGEIFDYVQAFNRLEFSVDLTRVHNPTAKTLYMNFFGKEYVVNPGETVELSRS